MPKQSIRKAKKRITALTGLIIGLATLVVVLSACTDRPVNQPPTAASSSIPPTPTAAQAASATPMAIPVEDTPTAPAVETPVVVSPKTSTGPITRPEVVTMWDSVDNFTNLIDRLDGLTEEEKESLKDYYAQLIELNREFDEKCNALLTPEEQAASKDMSNMGTPLYQQAIDKLEDAMQNDPACSKVHSDLDALMKQYSPLVIKMKMQLAPVMDQ